MTPAMPSRLDGRRPDRATSTLAFPKAVGQEQISQLGRITRVSGFAASQSSPVGHDMRMTESGNEVVTDPAETDSMAADEQLNAEVTAPAVPFGEWPSPITAADIASARVTGSFPTIIGSEAWWQQGLPDEGGRTTVMHSSGGKQ